VRLQSREDCARSAELKGKNVVVVGASNIVGKPMALMLMQRGATVSICQAKTKDLAQYTMLADILIVAAGRPNLILPQMIKTGAVITDVGINRLLDGPIVCDVDFKACGKGVLHQAGSGWRGPDDGNDTSCKYDRIRQAGRR
jgi:5,10-methylene-tetrahydrofolate dehydrogenase/methenyl tetrahydrofolate cyclohydrolase